ncbi:hypothetical protein BASA50_005384 [Batrachochytrium salamandrivorans]|uniref:THIF-type NAD/FAD binding fold domain-containing protein n=1 Tax=Batrachochytrium salamandrivorans TaxID=1357716 RepID=A0ABQ8FCU9_9FUNG|nr:hypothetical protein BASA50_005384 [Batrachochytrium salamandrivorans]
MFKDAYAHSWEKGVQFVMPVTALFSMNLTSSYRCQLLAAAVSGGLVVIASMWLRELLSKRKELRKFKVESAQHLDFDGVGPEELSSEAEALVLEQLSRNVAFLGQEGVARCRRSFVIVVGVGGVGSHAAHMLLRSGVEHIRLIDFDQVTLSSLNRHAVANRSDVGTFKVMAMKQHFLEIVPHAKIDPVIELFNKDAASRLLSGNPDYVLDCIDNLETKVDLLEYCYNHGIPIISSMGAGAKMDASRIQIADISDTFEDALSRSTRRLLRLRKIERGITVVYSTEKPTDVKLVPLVETQLDDPNEYALLPHFRSRILPVLGTIPALFGNAMASFVLGKIGGLEMDPIPVKTKRKITDKIFNTLLLTERGRGAEIKVNSDDVAFIVDEIYGGRSVISGSTTERLVMVRWDLSKPVQFGNLICLTKDEAKKHEQSAQGDLKSLYDATQIAKIQQRLELQCTLQKWRIE